MPRSLRAYLWDIEQAASDIVNFTSGKQLRDYEKDAMLRAAVERSFEIIGEALSQAQRFSRKWRAASPMSSKLSLFVTGSFMVMPPLGLHWSGTLYRPTCPAYARRLPKCCATLRMKV